MKSKIEMIEKEVKGTYILQDPDWLDTDWVIAPVNHPLPWYWDEDSDNRSSTPVNNKKGC